MKVEELMVGDWYEWSADGKDYFYQVKPEDFAKDYVTNFNPIPLTPEILGKNGFILINEGYELPSKYLATSRFFVFINKSSNSYYILVGGDWVTLMYVHQLQHALKLCGLTELANSLIV